MTERICSKCGESKPETLEFFGRRGTNDRGGLRPDCRECRKKVERDYYSRNYKTKIRASRKANAEKIAAYQAVYMSAYQRSENGKAARKRAIQAYMQTPAGHLSQVMGQQRYRARKAGVAGQFTLQDWLACVSAFGYSCAYCGVRGPLTQEHVEPISRGGLHDRSNIVPACGSCNSQKFSTPVDEWYPRQPFFSEDRLVRILDYLGVMV